jgi:hypothetical protein
MDIQKIKDYADAFDTWRIFPRIFIGVYIFLLIEVVYWFMALDNPNMEQAGLVSVIVGSGAAWFGLYVNSTRDGKENQFVSSSSEIKTKDTQNRNNIG